jgi:hypothetical protein
MNQQELQALFKARKLHGKINRLLPARSIRSTSCTFQAMQIPFWESSQFTTRSNHASDNDIRENRGSFLRMNYQIAIQVINGSWFQKTWNGDQPTKELEIRHIRATAGEVFTADQNRGPFHPVRTTSSLPVLKLICFIGSYFSIWPVN